MFGMPHTEYWALQQEALDRNEARTFFGLAAPFAVAHGTVGP